MVLNQIEHINLWLPRKEKLFLDRIKRKIRSRKIKSKIGISDHIVEVFSDKNYGLEETLLDDCGLRYPSEIRSQRFCAEEAVKNYLLAAFLGLNPVYVSTSDFKKRGLPHDFVIVKENSRNFLMLDWGNVERVRINDQGIYSQREIIANEIELLGPHEVGAMISLFRERKNIASIIDSPQLLNHKKISDGEIEKYAEHSKDKLIITEKVYTIPWGLPYYKRKVIYLHQDVKPNVEWGIIRRGKSSLELPTEISTGQTSIEIPFISELSLPEKREIILGTLYYLGRDKLNGDFLLSDRKRKEILRDITSLARNARTNESAHFLFYSALREKFQREASESYLDFLGFQIETNLDYGSDLKSVLRKSGIKEILDLEDKYRQMRYSHFQRNFDREKEEKLTSHLVSLL